MKRILILASISFLFLMTSCHKGGKGELTGVPKRGKYFEPSPLGMVMIAGQSFNMGPGDQDVVAGSTPTRTVDLSSFWMDDTEITNNEYRQFVYWVRDSVSRQLLSERFEEFKFAQDKKGNPIDPPILNWKRKIDLRNKEYTDVLEAMYYGGNDRILGRKELDTRKLSYRYSWVDLQQAALAQNAYDYKTQSYKGSVVDLSGKLVPVAGRSSFIMTEAVNIYPDTLVWIRDYSYAFNDPLTKKYFSHPGFDDYPVVGVNWKQAKAFCVWRTNYKNAALASKGDYGVQDYRLPSEAEWELAARGGLANSMYPWGGYYTRNKNGCFLANFKPMRGNYSDDGGKTTVTVATYDPNGYGLYDMSGNVAEWTISAYDESTYNFMHDLNPNFEQNALPTDPPAMKRKVTRGGSWKDIAYFIQVGTRTFEYQDTAKSYLGFRCVRSSIGADNPGVK
ncbi:MAG: SUMF1/EgtB/PvdO family nonheme iron enzyme [Bacteroidia bacterium]|nr:SUMF1/EgtB/PvdO family nonheme iron enzyme [Bacteroidia bacterium]